MLGLRTTKALTTKTVTLRNVLEWEFARFDGHFFTDEGKCLTCRESWPWKAAIAG